MKVTTKRSFFATLTNTKRLINGINEYEMESTVSAIMGPRFMHRGRPKSLREMKMPFEAGFNFK